MPRDLTAPAPALSVVTDAAAVRALRPLRVLMVLESNFTARGGGGAESQVRTLALHLRRLGHQVTVITPRLPGGPQATAERCYGIPVARLAYPNWRVVGGGLMALRHAAFLLQNRDRYDAWHVHIGHHLGVVTVLIGAVIGKPTVVKISGWWELEEGVLAPGAGLFGRIARGVFKRASAIQAISTRIAGELAKAGFPAERVMVLPNAVDTARFKVCAAARAPGQPFTAVFVGRLVAEKGLGTLLDAWGAAFAGRRDVRLCLVGGGGLDKELRAQAERLGIAAQVEFLGHKDRVEEVLAQAHVGVLPSRIEGLSNTLLEFMASGLPTLASRVSGSEDFVRPGENGWLFEVSDVAGLAACLREAEGLSAERLAELGRRARAEVEARSALDTVVGRLLALYRGTHPRELTGSPREMCGIVGIVAAPGAPLPPESVARAMNAAITHRGPDDEGVFRDAQAMIGMRRLSIIDLAGGHQPVHNEDGSLQAVFNGEIYNFRELRAELEGLGHRFYTHSDTEVIVHGYEQWGEDCFQRLDGMFGLALWDAPRRTLVLARDRFGEKPLFYTDDGQRLVFGSELKSLLEVPGLRTEIDAESVRGYVCFGYVPTPGSIFKAVKKLPPGHSLRYVDGKLSLRRYYTLGFGPKHRLGEREAEEELARLLDQAVKSRLVSDVPFGAFLSGGLDSSVVVALMSRHLSQPVRTFSIGFKEAAFNELSDARRVAEHLHTEHHELVVEPDAVDLLQNLVWYLDEPFADSSAVPTYLVAKLAREQVKMVLTGDGGDEAFGGYDRYLRFLALERVGPAKPMAAMAAQLGGKFVPGPNGYRLRRIAERLRQPFPDSYLSGVALTRADVADELLGDAVRGGPAGGGTGHYGSLAAAARDARGLGALDRCVSIDFASYLPDDILVKLDRMAMANSLEGRAPFLDHRLVDFAVRLPAELRVRDGRGKHLLRQAAARWLPAGVLKKPKQGFGIPLGQWFRGPLRSLAAEVIGSRELRERGLVSPKAAQRYLDGHLANEADYGEILWLVLSLELWARKYLDRARA